MLFAALTALGAQISIPMAPVPMTLQSLAVVLAGGVLGARWGSASMAVYLVAAAAGLPVLAEGRGGLPAVMGLTAGYLAAFPLAAWAVGYAARRGGLARPGAGILILAAAHLLILGIGAGWLALEVGGMRALEGGFTPFLIGAVAKSVLAWLILAGPRRAYSR